MWWCHLIISKRVRGTRSNNLKNLLFLVLQARISPEITNFLLRLTKIRKMCRLQTRRNTHEHSITVKVHLKLRAFWITQPEIAIRHQVQNHPNIVIPSSRLNNWICRCQTRNFADLNGTHQAKKPWALEIIQAKNQRYQIMQISYKMTIASNMIQKIRLKI